MVLKQLEKLNQCLNWDILLGEGNCFNDQVLQFVNAQIVPVSFSASEFVILLAPGECDYTGMREEVRIGQIQYSI